VRCSNLSELASFRKAFVVYGDSKLHVGVGQLESQANYRESAGRIISASLRSVTGAPVNLGSYNDVVTLIYPHVVSYKTRDGMGQVTHYVTAHHLLCQVEFVIIVMCVLER